MFYYIGMNSSSFTITIHILEMTKETMLFAKQRAERQRIQILMNINRIINKYIISKYVKRENKPG